MWSICNCTCSERVFLLCVFVWLTSAREQRLADPLTRLRRMEVNRAVRWDLQQAEEGSFCFSRTCRSSFVYRTWFSCAAADCIVSRTIDHISHKRIAKPLHDLKMTVSSLVDRQMAFSDSPRDVVDRNTHQTISHSVDRRALAWCQRLHLKRHLYVV